MREESRLRIDDRRWPEGSAVRPRRIAPRLAFPRVGRSLPAPDRTIDPRRSPSALAPASAWRRANAAKSQEAEPWLHGLPANAPSPCPRRWAFPRPRPGRRLGPQREDSMPLRSPKAPPPQDLELYWNSPSDASHKLLREEVKAPSGYTSAIPSGTVNQFLLYNRNHRIQTQ